MVAATLAIVLLALLGVAVASRRAMRTASGGLIDAARTASLVGVAPLFADVADDKLNARLEQVGRSLGMRLLLFDESTGRVFASTAGLRRAGVRYREGRLEIEEQELDRAGRVEAQRTVVVGVPEVVLPGPAGPRGLLFALPGAADGGAATPIPGLDRALLTAVLFTAVLALALSWFSTRRIVQPIEEFTRAARRMGAGDLAVRVGASGPDELGELGAAFNAMADARARAEALRQALVSDVAHELRSPLTNLRCHLEAVQDGLQPPDESTLALLHEEIVLLSRLVDDLQDLALAEAGGLTLRLGPVALGEACDVAVAGLRRSAAERNVTLESAVEPGLVVRADRERLGQMLRNLLANAVAHSPSGAKVTLGATVRSDEVLLAVSDQGPGIAAGHLPHIFERFYRADPSRSRSTGGAGLGLAIVQKLAQAHGGRVEVETMPGEGSRFTIMLPATAFTRSSHDRGITSG